MRFYDPCCGVGSYPILAAERGAIVFGSDIIPQKLANALWSLERQGHRIEQVDAKRD
jgi:hypothetical protein